MGITEKMKEKILIFDGGMGSLLQARGLQPGQLPEVWNITHKDILVDIHKSYLCAGADIVTTNTFGANGIKFHQDGEFSLENIVKSAVENAKTAIQDFYEEHPDATVEKKYVALDLGPTGKLLKPMGDLDFEDAVQIYAEVVEIGKKAGADFVLIETMSDSYEAKAAVLAAKEHSDLPVVVTMVFDEKGKLLTGGNIESAVAMLEGLRVDALGMNCGLGPVQMKSMVKRMLDAASIPVIVNPNAGLPRTENGKTVYDIDCDQFAKEMKQIVELGASGVGGCCGTTPEYIKKTAENCCSYAPKTVIKKNKTVVTSYANAVEIGKQPVIIGERINPTGKSKFKQALRDHDLDYIMREGIAQQDHGAHILDVNVGLPEIDEASMMEEVVKELQSITDLPLQIDTTNKDAMERALRVYNGKPLINSVNGKQEEMDKIFPLVKKYGGVVIGLTLDEKGIPETAAERYQIALKIYEEAQKYGIEKKDIIIDALCMTVSADSKSALTTLETLRLIKEKSEGKTILGVSNISFGLPQRELVNSTFFTMALQNGLNAAIINPNSERMMSVYYAFRALYDLDENCTDYIEQYNKNTEVKTAVKTEEKTLKENIIRGLKEDSRHCAEKLLFRMEPLEIINSEMIPALDTVGKKFENGTLFLPQLLMSAEAANGAFEVLKDHMKKNGQEQQKKGKIVLATVKGDIHDIGKNIVKVLLENYSYEIIDLGRDVAPEKIVETVIEQNVKLVGLSALMTTTVPYMEETIKQLNQKAPFAKIMVGGAVLTKEYADSIGADQYCHDAMASVHYAERIL